jgi:hypothetical protein
MNQIIRRVSCHFLLQILRRPSLQRRAGSRSDVTHHAVTSQLPQVPAGAGSRPIGEQVIPLCALSLHYLLFSQESTKQNA